MCNEPAAPSNGSVTLSSPLLGVGSIATYTCDPGYVLVGQTTSACQNANTGEIGVWNSSTPICEGITALDTRRGHIQINVMNYSDHHMPAIDPAQQWSSHHFLWHTWSHPW